jgi:hypothetical protein
MPVSIIFENLEYGSGIEEIIENYGVTRDQIRAVLDFAAWSAAPPSAGIDPARARQLPLASCASADRRDRRGDPGSYAEVEIPLPPKKPFTRS